MVQLAIAAWVIYAFVQVIAIPFFGMVGRLIGG